MKVFLYYVCVCVCVLIRKYVYTLGSYHIRKMESAYLFSYFELIDK